jgi:hypothetical protein
MTSARRPLSDQPMPPAERMRRYRARRRLQGLHVVTRWESRDPESSGGTYSPHRLLEARSLALHCVIARKIDAQPALLRVARKNLERWRRRASGGVPAYVRDWEALLAKPWPVVAGVITELSERSAALRQSSPFAGVLTPAERRRVYEAFRA